MSLAVDQAAQQKDSSPAQSESAAAMYANAMAAAAEHGVSELPRPWRWGDPPRVNQQGVSSPSPPLLQRPASSPVAGRGAAAASASAAVSANEHELAEQLLPDWLIQRGKPLAQPEPRPRRPASAQIRRLSPQPNFCYRVSKISDPVSASVWADTAQAQARDTGACTINRPCAQQYVGKYQSCMVISGRLIVHAPAFALLDSDSRHR